MLVQIFLNPYQIGDQGSNSRISMALQFNPAAFKCLEA